MSILNIFCPAYWCGGMTNMLGDTAELNFTGKSPKEPGKRDTAIASFTSYSKVKATPEGVKSAGYLSAYATAKQREALLRRNVDSIEQADEEALNQAIQASLEYLYPTELRILERLPEIEHLLGKKNIRVPKGDCEVPEPDDFEFDGLIPNQRSALPGAARCLADQRSTEVNPDRGMYPSDALEKVMRSNDPDLLHAMLESSSRIKPTLNVDLMQAELDHTAAVIGFNHQRTRDACEKMITGTERWQEAIDPDILLPGYGLLPDHQMPVFNLDEKPVLINLSQPARCDKFCRLWFQKNNLKVITNDGGRSNNCLILALLQHATGKYGKQYWPELVEEAAKWKEWLRVNHRIKTNEMLYRDANYSVLLLEEINQKYHCNMRVIYVEPFDSGVPFLAEILPEKIDHRANPVLIYQAGQHYEAVVH
jgi:hypothetical protein